MRNKSSLVAVVSLASLAAVLLATAGCKPKPKDAPAAATDAAAAAAVAPEADAAAAVAPAPAAPDAGPAAAPAAFACGDRRASKIEMMGMGSAEIVLDCKDGKPTITDINDEARGDRTKETHDLTPAAFEAFWTRANAAKWRELAEACPPVDPRPESAGITDLELEIVDGATKKKITCGGFDLGPAHKELMAAFDEALESTAKPAEK